MKFYPDRDHLFVGEVRNGDVGVEVGVREGFFSRFILETCNPTFMFGIDIEKRNDAAQLEEDFGNYTLVIGRSPEIADHFDDNSLDFIYIDADHKEDAVRKDLRAWYKKLKPGGLMAGDDYAVVSHPVEGIFGVIPAVNEFVDEMALELYLTGVFNTDVADYMEFALEQGIEMDKFHRKQPYKQFLNPNWYFRKPKARNAA